MNVARDSIALLRRREFTFLMFTQWLAQASDGLVGVALAKKITFGGAAGFNLDLEKAKDPEDALFIILLTFLPYMLVSPFLGVAIDRWDRRKLLIGSNAVRAVILAAVALIGLDTLGDAALYGSLLLTLASTRLLLAIKGAGLPAALEEQNLIQGNSISQAGSAIFQLGGAGVAVAASGILDARWIVLAGALGYGLATIFAVGARRLGYPRATVSLGQAIGRVLGDIAEGIREVTRRATAALALTSFLILRTLLTFVVLATVFASRGFIAEQGSVSSTVPAAAGAAGAVLGFLLAHRIKDRVAPTTIVAGALLAGGVGLLAFGGVISVLGISAMAFVVGLSFFMGKVAVDTLMQQALADAFRGRGFSLQDIAYNLSWVIPAFVLFLLLEEDNARILLVSAGAVFLALGGLIALWARTASPEPAPAGTPAEREP